MRHSIKMIVLLLTVIFFLQTVQAHENLTIVKVDHTLIKERQSGEWTIRTFLINITLANSGDTISDGTTVSIEDEEGFVLHKNSTLNPGETKVFSFEWNTRYSEQQVINISYEPTNKNIPRTSYNSGKTTLVIEAVTGYDAGGSEATPGFEMMLLVTVFVFFCCKRKR